MKNFILFFLITLPCFAKLKIAVIDSGYTPNSLKVPLCPEGHRDFTSKLPIDKIPEDKIGHGTHVTSTIHQKAQGLMLDPITIPIDKTVWNTVKKLNAMPEPDYCFIIIKVFTDNKTSHRNDNPVNEGFKYAASLKDLYLINFSGGGETKDPVEEKWIKTLLNNNVIFVAAAGNENKNIEKSPYYPASYPGVIAVGAMVFSSKEFLDNKFYLFKKDKGYYYKLPPSNYGTKIVWEVGSYWSFAGVGLNFMQGSSQAAAIHSGRLINEKLRDIKNGKK